MLEKLYYDNQVVSSDHECDRDTEKIRNQESQVNTYIQHCIRLFKLNFQEKVCVHIPLAASIKTVPHDSQNNV